jgi:two-component sensor histidine kinase
MRAGVPLGNIWFPNRPESVRLTRRFVELVAKAYDIEHVAETAVLLVSELTTNVTKHVRPASNTMFQVVASRTGERMRVEVHDASSQFPVMRHSNTLDENGRGLCLIRELANDHGAYSLPCGKSTWFELVAWRGGTDA